VLTHRLLLTSVWGPGYGDQMLSLRVMITQLQKKIEVDPARPRLIVTEPGVGYRFQSPP
jgi:two-component system KDP operon response regulator KdpE